MKLRLEIDLSMFLANTGLPDLDAVREYMEAGLYDGPGDLSAGDVLAAALVDTEGNEHPIDFRRMETDPDFRARVVEIIGDEDTILPDLEDLLRETDDLDDFDLILLDNDGNPIL